ncbi:hypothetical protein HYW75_07195, partial [Candidatus Pacearchaeota archaeon]|nr:hypothetical protein [Candidatus Pacearchaeota archaeon]
MTNEIQQEIERDESNPLVRAMLLNLPVSGVYPRNMPFSYCVNFEGIEDPLLGGVLITGERNFQKDNLRVQVELNFDYLKSIGDLEFGLEVIRNISCAFG